MGSGEKHNLRAVSPLWSPILLAEFVFSALNLRTSRRRRRIFLHFFLFFIFCWVQLHYLEGSIYNVRSWRKETSFSLLILGALNVAQLWSSNFPVINIIYYNWKGIKHDYWRKFMMGWCWLLYDCNRKLCLLGIYSQNGRSIYHCNCKSFSWLNIVWWEKLLIVYNCCQFDHRSSWNCTANTHKWERF